MIHEKYCLVLSGGGAKGVYHIGAWRALRELGIEIEAVIGNSIGSIIAAYIVQNKHEELEDIGNRIDLNTILNVPDELVVNGELKITSGNKAAFVDFYKNATSNKGLDTTPLKNLLTQIVDEETIRKGKIDFGVMTFSLSEMKPREVFIEEMEDGEIVNYALASSAIPGFHKPNIAGKQYIDGGVYDNMPYAMARKRGYRNIILVDISGAGINRKPDIRGTRTTYIKNSINMGGMLVFQRGFLSDFNTLGYLDTMKVFGQLRGIDYFIEPDEKVENAFVEFLKSEKGQEEVFSRGKIGRNVKRTPPNLIDAIRKLIPKRQRTNQIWLPALADCAATSLGLNKIKQYDYRELFDSLAEEQIKVTAKTEAWLKSDRKKLVSNIRQDMKKKRTNLRPYAYHLLVDLYLPERLKASLRKHIIDHHPDLASGIFFLEIMKEFREYLDGARV